MVLQINKINMLFQAGQYLLIFRWALTAVIFVFCLQVGTNLVQADELLEQWYFYEKMDALWLQMVEKPGATPFVDAELVSDRSQFPLQHQTCLPLEPGDCQGTDNAIIGEQIAMEQGGSGAAKKFTYVTVAPLSGVEAGKLQYRLAALKLYHSRSHRFHALKSDSPQMVAEIKKRHLSALSELFLITMRLYFAEKDFSSKCNRLRDSKTYMNLPAASDVLPAWEDTAGQALNVRNTFFQYIKDETVCKLRTRPTQKEVLREITENKIKPQLRLKIKTHLDQVMRQITEAQEDLQKAFTLMKEGIVIDLENVLGLKRSVENGAANADLVEKDKLKAEKKVSEIDEAKDFDEVRNAATKGPNVLNKANEWAEKIKGETVNALKLIEKLGFKLKVSSCGNLHQRIDYLADDKHALEQFRQDFSSCLNQIKALVKEKMIFTDEEKLQQALADKIKALSNSMLNKYTNGN